MARQEKTKKDKNYRKMQEKKVIHICTKCVYVQFICILYIREQKLENKVQKDNDKIGEVKNKYIDLEKVIVVLSKYLFSYDYQSGFDTGT